MNLNQKRQYTRRNRDTEREAKRDIERDVKGDTERDAGKEEGKCNDCDFCRVMK